MKVGSKEFLDDRGIKAWAGIPMEVLQRATARDKDIEERLRHAMILWSWCGLEASETIVRKDALGWIVRDEHGNPVHARLSDFAAMLNVDKSIITRTAQALREQGFLNKEKPMALIYKPGPADPNPDSRKTDNLRFTVAGIVVSTATFPADPEARAEAVRFVESCSTRWKKQLSEVKTDNRRLLVQGLSERGIIIGLKSPKSSKNERTKDTPAPQLRSFVPSPSPIKEKLRTFLTEFPGRFGLPTLPDDRALDAIAAHLPNDGVLWRFSDLVTRQKPKPNGGGWMYFVPLAISCEQAWQADEDLVGRAREEAQAKLERWRREAEAESASGPEDEPGEKPEPIRVVHPDREQREAMRRETSIDMALLTAEIEEKIARKQAKTEALMKGQGKAESA